MLNDRSTVVCVPVPVISGRTGSRAPWQRRVLDGLLAGRHAALGEWYVRCAPTVYGFSQAITGIGSDAERITLAVFVHLWQQPQRCAARFPVCPLPDQATLLAIR